MGYKPGDLVKLQDNDDSVIEVIVVAKPVAHFVQILETLKDPSGKTVYRPGLIYETDLLGVVEHLDEAILLTHSNPYYRHAGLLIFGEQCEEN